MNFELGISLRNLGWGSDAFFIETLGHIEIWENDNIFIYCLKYNFLCIKKGNLSKIKQIKSIWLDNSYNWFGCKLRID